jgi:hypothetical protein
MRYNMASRSCRAWSTAQIQHGEQTRYSMASSLRTTERTAEVQHGEQLRYNRENR